MNDIIQPLRFYTATSYQLNNRHVLLNFNNIVPLIVDKTHLLPFCLYNAKTDTSEHAITICSAIRLDGLTYNILANMDFEFYWDNLITPTKQYIFYPGTSTIPALRHGIYYLHLSDGTNHWYSDLFKVGVYSTCTLEFKHTYSFGNLVMPTGKYYKASYRCYTFDPAEFLEYSDVNKNDDNFDIPAYQRIDKLRTCLLLGDSNAFDAIKLIQLMDTIYITDEIGKRSLIEISEVSQSTKGGNYMNISLKYRIKDDSIITVNKTLSSLKNTQEGTAFVTPGEEITFNGDPIEFGGEHITFN